MAEFKEISREAMGDVKLLLNEPAPVRRTMVSFVDMCCSILKPKSSSDVLLPYAGDVQIANLLPKCSCECYEPTSKVWEYGQKYCNAESIETQIQAGSPVGDAEGKLYDYVFTFPFGRLQDRKLVADYLYNIADKCLKDKGVMCCLLPAGFCFSRDWVRLRNIARERQYNTVSILLPWGLCQPISGISLCAFILFKDNGGRVTLVDAQDESFIEKQDDMRVLKTQAIVDTLNQKDKRYVWSGSVGELINDDNLSPEYYLLMQYEPTVKEGEKIYKLGELIEVVPDGFCDKECAVGILGVRDLSSDYINCNISFEDLPHKRAKYFDGNRVTSTKCLFAGYDDGVLRVGRGRGFSTANIVKLDYGIIPFNLRSNDVITEDFLLKSITSDSVAEQARILKGKIPDDLFLQFKIVMPSKEEQERLCKEDAQKSFGKAEGRAQESNKEFLRDMHMKTHAIGQTIFALKGWWAVLQRARRENEGAISDDTVVGNLRQVTVGEIYENLENTVDRLQQQIYMMDRGNGLKKEDFALTTFLEEYIKDNKRNEFEFKYNAVEHHRRRSILADDRIVEGETEAYRLNHKSWGGGDGEPLEYVKFSKEALTMVLDNIVSNACCHGFTDPDAKNVIKIEVAEDPKDDNAFLIRVSNNGKPIDEKRFPIANVFNFGSSLVSGKEGHFGLGGYEVKHLMWEFGGDAKIISTPSEEFTVCYELKLPKGNGFTYKKNA